MAPPRVAFLTLILRSMLPAFDGCYQFGQFVAGGVDEHAAANVTKGVGDGSDHNVLLLR